jgi:uncharacterized membrane protein YeaQ/YmgE (transglycosylase-associated protein family)
MGLLYFLLIGLVVGWLAGILVKGRGFGVLGDILVGIVGAFVGGFLAGVFGIQPVTGLGALAMSVVGAVVVLAIVKAVRRI